MTICEACDYEFDSDVSGYWCESCEEWLCNDCGPCSNEYGRRRDSRIHAYNYRPSRFNPKGNFPGDPLLGVELEVGGDSCDIADAVGLVDGREEHLYLKEDGSICGAEIVTHPMTLEWARGYGFDKLLSGLRDHCYVNDNYGLHIHVARNAFRRYGRQSSTMQLMWLLFIYRNTDEVERIARRTSEQWASFRKPTPAAMARKARYIERDDRYVAVNCNNVKTYELRFFASTLDFTEFFAAMEFADASVRYVRAHHVNDVLRNGALTWRHFSEWVRERDYPHLVGQL